MRIRVDDGVAQVEFNRPERLNAFTGTSYALLRDACGELGRLADEVRVVIFRGAGERAFAVGNDITDFTGLRSGQQGVDYEAYVVGVVRGIQELPQVTIAAIRGACVGAGLAVATHCDLRVCTPDARFGYPIARTVGNLLSAGVLYRCVAVFGESLTREMLLASRLVSADRAHGAGAVNTLVAPEQLEDELDDFSRGLRQAAPLTLAATKEQLLALTQRSGFPPTDDPERIARVYASEDFAEGVASFIDKRQASFRGR